MTNRTRLALTVALFVCVLALAAPRVAEAHDGAPRLELGAERLAPGAALEVRGLNATPPDSAVTLRLVGEGGDRVLGEAIGDAHGDFAQTFVLPSDLTPGVYVLQIGTAETLITSAPLTIVGAPVLGEDEGEGQRAEEEPLLVVVPPRPTPLAGVAPTAAANRAAINAPPAQNPRWPLVAFGAVAGVSLLAVFLRGRLTRQ